MHEQVKNDLYNGLNATVSNYYLTIFPVVFICSVVKVLKLVGLDPLLNKEKMKNKLSTVNTNFSKDKKIRQGRT